VMVRYAVYGCKVRLDEGKKVSFFSIPDYQGKADYELRKKCRDGYLAAISREDIDTSVLHKYKICAKHFISGKPLYMYKVNDPDWLPSLHLGHKKDTVSLRSDENVARYKWLKKREQKKAVYEEMVEEVPDIVAQLIEEVTAEECQLICAGYLVNIRVLMEERLCVTAQQR